MPYFVNVCLRIGFAFQESRERRFSESTRALPYFLQSDVNAFKGDHISFANSLLAKLRTGPSRPWSDRYLFGGVQRLSTHLNASRLTMLKRVEHLSAVTFRT